MVLLFGTISEVRKDFITNSKNYAFQFGFANSSFNKGVLYSDVFVERWNSLHHNPKIDDLVLHWRVNLPRYKLAFQLKDSDYLVLPHTYKEDLSQKAEKQGLILSNLFLDKLFSTIEEKVVSLDLKYKKAEEFLQYDQHKRNVL